MDELWKYVGIVPISKWPDERFGFGIETESKIKIGTTITHEFAVRIVSDHNKIILKQV